MNVNMTLVTMITCAGRSKRRPRLDELGGSSRRAPSPVPSPGAPVWPAGTCSLAMIVSLKRVGARKGAALSPRPARLADGLERESALVGFWTYAPGPA